MANLSSYYFIRVFKAQMGKTPYEYLLDIKMEKAREMLKQRNHTITEICYECGFNSISHFTTAFKRKVGVTPTYYRKSALHI
ncbi:MAG: helix-turn-helix domain-containing protein [Bacillota bacterium]